MGAKEALERQLEMEITAKLEFEKITKEVLESKSQLE